jgi:hypothetical protein
VQHLLLILVTLGVITWLSRGSAGVPDRLILGFVVLSAVVATWSLVSGILFADFPGVVVALMIPLFAAITVLAVRTVDTANGNAGASLRDPLAAWAIPVVFLAIVGWVAVGGPVRRMQWVVLQWDAASNPGVVATTRVLPGLDFMPEVVTGWELYPRGSHALAGMFSTAGSLGQESFAKSTLVGFYSTVWVVYALLILAVGLLAIRVARLFRVSTAAEVAALVLAQSIFVTPFLMEHLLLMHSLSFMCSLLAVVYLAIVVLDDKSVSFSHRLLASAVTFIVVANSYPILLPLVLVMSFALFARRGTRGWIIENERCVNTSFFVVLLAFTAVSVMALVTYQDRVAASAGFQQGGQLIPVPFGWLITLVALSGAVLLALLLSKRLATAFAFLCVVSGAVMVPVVIWAIVGNFDRSFGVNYYPKKAEYVTLTMLIPVAAGSFGVFVNSLVRLMKGAQAIAQIAVALVFVFGATQVVKGPGEYLVHRAGGTSEAAGLLAAAIAEAGRPGMSIVFDQRRPDLSINASLLSNYVDESFWSVPNSQTRNFVLGQQILGLQSGQPLTDLCPFVNSPTDGPGRIQELSTGTSMTCP